MAMHSRINQTTSGTSNEAFDDERQTNSQEKMNIDRGFKVETEAELKIKNEKE